MTRPTVYLATAWADQPMIRRAVAAIEHAGLELRARWVEVCLAGEAYETGTRDERARSIARADLADLDAADGLLLVPNRTAGTGHHVEFGYALARGKPTVIAGAGWTVFHALVPAAASLDGAAAELWRRLNLERDGRGR